MQLRGFIQCFAYFAGQTNRMMRADTPRRFFADPFFSNTWHFQIWVCAALLLVGMVFAPFLQSVALIGLIVCTLLRWYPDSDFPFRWNPDLQSGLYRFIRRPDFWVPLLYFLLVLGSSYTLEDPGYWLERLRIKAPFLVMPLVFFMLPVFSNRWVAAFWYFLLGLLSLTSLGIIVNYVLHADSVHALLRAGQPLPMPCNHIRYSLLHVMGIVGGLYVLEKGIYLRDPRERVWVISAVAWLVVAQHLLAVRSGLVAMYVVLLYGALRYMWRSRRWLWGVPLLVLLAIGPLIAYYSVPSLRVRVDYARYDQERFLKGAPAENLSDGSRWVSLELGWQLFMQAPWTGVGAGNLRLRMEQEYAAEYPQFQRRLMPHNQLLFVAAGTGLLGLAVFMAAFIIPLWYRKNYLFFPFAALHLIVLVSFVAEATIENAMGVAFFIFFWGFARQQEVEGKVGGDANR